MRLVILRLRAISTSFGYIRGEASGFRVVSLSDLGIKYVEVEGDLRREEEQEEGRA
jgi:hypothetical protein